MRLKDFSNTLHWVRRARYRSLAPWTARTATQFPRMQWPQVSALISALCFSLSALSLAQAQQIIVNDDVAISDIDRNRARLIFTMRINQWSDQLPVAVFVLPDEAPLHQAFAKSALGVFPYQLRQTWDRQVFSGTGQAPLQVANEAEMVQRVRQTPGAIGYVGQPLSLPGIKVVEVK